MARSVYGVQLIDDLHNYFPELLYNTQRFTSVQDVLHYVTDSTRRRFDLFSNSREMYTANTAHTRVNQQESRVNQQSYVQQNQQNQSRAAPFVAHTAPTAPIAVTPIHFAPITYTPVSPTTSTTSTTSTAPVTPEPIMPNTIEAIGQHLRNAWTTPRNNSMSSVIRPLPYISLQPDTGSTLSMYALDILGWPPVGTTHNNTINTNSTITTANANATINALDNELEAAARILSSLMYSSNNLRGSNSFLDPIIVCPTIQQIDQATSQRILTDPIDGFCSICQENMIIGDNVRRITECTHAFHASCIDIWFTRNVRCPICRYDIRESEDLDQEL